MTERVQDGSSSGIEGESRYHELVDRLEAERAVLHAIMENTDTHLAYLDPDFRFVAVNSAYARGSGHTEEELLGRGHFELFPNEENEALFRRARDTGEPIEFRAKPFEFADQPWRGVTYWDWRLTPVKGDQEGVIGLAFSLTDVTQSVRAKRASEALNEINDVIHATLDSAEVMRKVTPRVAQVLGCEAALIGLGDRAGVWRIAEVSGLPDEIKRRSFRQEDLPSVELVVRTGEPTVVSGDIVGDTRGLAHEVGARSLMVAPLAFSEGHRGVLACGYLSGPGEFDEGQLDFARKVAASLSLALENARLYANEHAIADRLQGALLALPSSIPGVEFAHAYNSATEAARVGGDFYDLFEIEHDLVAITIGDVAGKGLDAAVLTSLVKNAIRAHASEKGAEPARILELTNEVVYRSTAEESFVTAFFAVLDRSSGRLVYANAGHTTAVLGCRDGRQVTLPSTGPLLGAFRCVAYEQADVGLDLGELLFLYTDGLTEARRDGEFFGEERLFEVLTRLRERDAASTLRGVVDDVLEFSRGRLHDDLALLALRRTAEGPAPSSSQELPLQTRLKG